VRYVAVDGRIGSRSGFDTKRLANDYAKEIEADQRRGTWVDPRAGKTTVAVWAALWANALDVEVRTEDDERAASSHPFLPNVSGPLPSRLSGSRTTPSCSATAAADC
jgi:hypothetical protein